MLCGGWSLESIPDTLAQFVDRVQEIQISAVGANSKEKKASEWVFDFLQVLGDSVNDIDSLIKFVPYKLVSIAGLYVTRR